MPKDTTTFGPVTRALQARLGELIDFSGKLAQFRGSYIDRDQPLRIDWIAVSDIASDRYSHLIGCTVSGHGSGHWSG